MRALKCNCRTCRVRRMDSISVGTEPSIICDGELEASSRLVRRHGSCLSHASSQRDCQGLGQEIPEPVHSG
jgi:hypothetical protein